MPFKFSGFNDFELNLLKDFLSDMPMDADFLITRNKTNDKGNVLWIGEPPIIPQVLKQRIKDKLQMQAEFVSDKYQIKGNFFVHDGKQIEVSDTEKQILLMLLNSTSEVRSEEILRKLGYNEGVETNVVATHIYNIRQKVGDVIKTTEKGYMLKS